MLLKSMINSQNGMAIDSESRIKLQDELMGEMTRQDWVELYGSLDQDGRKRLFFIVTNVLGYNEAVNFIGLTMGERIRNEALDAVEAEMAFEREELEDERRELIDERRKLADEHERLNQMAFELDRYKDQLLSRQKYLDDLKETLDTRTSNLSAWADELDKQFKANYVSPERLEELKAAEAKLAELEKILNA